LADLADVIALELGFFATFPCLFCIDRSFLEAKNGGANGMALEILKCFYSDIVELQLNIKSTHGLYI
jgi:hypothetical protein